MTKTKQKITYKFVVALKKKNSRLFTIFPFSRLFPGLENCWANFKTVRTLFILFPPSGPSMKFNISKWMVYSLCYFNRHFAQITLCVCELYGGMTAFMLFIIWPLNGSRCYWKNSVFKCFNEMMIISWLNNNNYCRTLNPKPLMLHLSEKL